MLAHPAGLVAHAGNPLAPHDLWGAWSTDPLVLSGLLAAAAAYATGTRAMRRRPASWRQVTFWAGLLAIVVALVSPLDAAAGSLASAHMLQHILLVLVAAPALALAAPGPALLRGTPAGMRRAATRLRVAAGVRTPRTRRLWGPAAAWLTYTAVLWLWHARVLYEAALRDDTVHAVEHATMLGAALLLWGVVARAHGARRIDRGQALLVVFAAGMQGVLLSALLTFAGTPWYTAYGTSTAAWGLTPLVDQQLAGVTLWASGGVVHLAAALLLLRAWLREAAGDADGSRRRPVGHGQADQERSSAIGRGIG